MKLPSFTAIKGVVLDILFPPLCLACARNLPPSEKTEQCCASCAASVMLFETLFCPTCGARLPNNTKICHKETPYLLAAATSYRNETVQKLIWRLKYERLQAAARPLMTMLTRYLSELDYDFSNFIVVPIPLHKNRLNERGFNQAELLAEGVARVIARPLATDILRRVKPTTAQAKMRDRAERSANLSGAFAVNPGTDLRGKSILLVDDVFTSGATIGEAVKTVKTAGAKMVIALVVARAI